MTDPTDPLPTPVRQFLDPEAYHVNPSRRSNLRSTHTDVGNLVLPKKVSKKDLRTTIDSDSYSDAIGKIIERDYFPDLAGLTQKLEWLEALESGDQSRISATKLKIATNLRNQDMGNSGRSNGSSHAPEVKEFDRTQREKNFPVLSSKFEVDDDDSLSVVSWSANIHPSLKHRSTFEEENSIVDSVAGNANDEPGEFDNISLTTFNRVFANEDNVSFESNIEKKLNTDMEKKWWMHRSLTGEDKLLLMNAEKAKALSGSLAILDKETGLFSSGRERTSSASNNDNHTSLNALFFPPDLDKSKDIVLKDGVPTKWSSLQLSDKSDSEKLLLTNGTVALSSYESIPDVSPVALLSAVTKSEAKVVNKSVKIEKANTLMPPPPPPVSLSSQSSAAPSVPNVSGTEGYDLLETPLVERQFMDWLRKNPHNLPAGNILPHEGMSDAAFSEALGLPATVTLQQIRGLSQNMEAEGENEHLTETKTSSSEIPTSERIFSMAPLNPREKALQALLERKKGTPMAPNSFSSSTPTLKHDSHIRKDYIRTSTHRHALSGTSRAPTPAYAAASHTPLGISSSYQMPNNISQSAASPDLRALLDRAVGIAPSSTPLSSSSSVLSSSSSYSRKTTNSTRTFSSDVFGNNSVNKAQAELASRTVAAAVRRARDKTPQPSSFSNNVSSTSNRSNYSSSGTNSSIGSEWNGVLPSPLNKKSRFN